MKGGAVSPPVTGRIPRPTHRESQYRIGRKAKRPGHLGPCLLELPWRDADGFLHDLASRKLNWRTQDQRIEVPISIGQRLWQVLDAIWDYNPATSTAASIDFDINCSSTVCSHFPTTEFLDKSSSWKRARFANRIREILPTVRHFAAIASLEGRRLTLRTSSCHWIELI
jgi:hypothetical protein